MNSNDIRQRIAYDPKTAQNVRETTRTFLNSISKQYPIAITLTFKQSYAVHTNAGTHYKKLDIDAVKQSVKHFQHKMNQQVFGSAAKRHGKHLSYIPVVEGVRTGKNLHVHMAVGNIPAHVMFNEIEALVNKAKLSVELLDKQHKVALAYDSGWLAEYLLKEVTANNTDNILWDLA